MKKLISVFTPVYNRAGLIEKCYNSLISQTDKDFLWLVIDDGSTDNIKEKISKFKKDGLIEIDFFSKENGGKHTAYNLAISKCKTDYFAFLDSDDYYKPDAIATFKKYCKQIDNKDDIVGIIGNRITEENKVLGNEMPNIDSCSSLELYQVYGHIGDTCSVYKTSILNKYHFPVYEGEKLMQENVIFDKVGEKYKLKIFHDKIYVSEYLQDGYSKNILKHRINSPNGYALSLKIMSETAINFKKKIGWTILYVIWCKKMNIRDYCKNYRNLFWVIVLFPIIELFMIIKYPKFFFDSFSLNE